MKRLMIAIVIAAFVPTIQVEAVSATLSIPSIGVDTSIVMAYRSGDTWNVSRITKSAAFLYGEPLPGQGDTFVVAHSELAKRKPGVFYTLKSIKIGDMIYINYNGVKYSYRVDGIRYVVPTDMSALAHTGGGNLTLLTCDGYDGLSYTTRLVVHAKQENKQ